MKQTLIACAVAALPMVFNPVPSLGDDGKWFASHSVLTQRTGEGIYAAVCAGCHMPNGAGAEGAGQYPSLVENKTLEFTDYAINLIIHGQKAMPPLGDVLDDEQIAAVVAYIRISFGNDYDSPVTAEDAAAYR